MSDSTPIEWSDATWNPTTGCDRVSPGCDHCYAMTLAKRLKAMGSPKYQTDGAPGTSGPGFGLVVHEDALSLPLTWRKPRRIFVNSMSDLFHDLITDEFIARVFAVMATTPEHTYQVLTKRHGRMRSLVGRGSFGDEGFADMVEEAMAEFTHAGLDHWPLPNVWLGVSVENQQWANIRIPALLETPAAVRFLSCEPLLGPIDLSSWLGPVDWPPCFDEHSPAAECSRCIQPEWVITGGESGPDFRSADPGWFRSIRDQCNKAGVAYLHKQNGGRTPKENGRLLDGRTWDEYPAGAS